MDKQQGQQSTRQTDEQRVRKLIAESGATLESLTELATDLHECERLERKDPHPLPTNAAEIAIAGVDWFYTGAEIGLCMGYFRLNRDSTLHLLGALDRCRGEYGRMGA